MSSDEVYAQFARCDEDGCHGARLQGKHCLEHLTDEEFAVAVVGLRAGEHCVFTERIRLEVAARVVSARAATFTAGALLRVRWAEIALDEADFARPSTLSGATAWRSDNELPPVCLRDARQIELRAAPAVDNAARRTSARAVALERRSARLPVLRGPRPGVVEHRGQLRMATHTGRASLRRARTIAEEHRWRGWSDPPTQAPEWLQGRDDTEPLQPAQIAALYRALRKAREEDKDQPGAGDLYYGEMDMRRHSRRDDSASPTSDSQNAANHTNDASSRRRLRIGGDTTILHLYWLLSGYGLRPARALIALAATLLAGAALLWWFGFHDPRTYGRSLLFSAESAISLLRPPEAKLSAGGEIVQIVLRLLGPLLFGLVLLAVRARVKR